MRRVGRRAVQGVRVMKSKVVAVVFLAMSLSAPLSLGVGATPKEKSVSSMSEDEKFLRNIAHEFEEGFNSGDVDRLMRFYGDTYVDVNLRNPVQTKAERRAYYAKVMARPG